MNLTRAKLASVNLANANLYGATLASADPLRANLDGASLASANLTCARNVTNAQVRCTWSDHSTTLPTGITRPMDNPTDADRACD